MLLSLLLHTCTYLLFLPYILSVSLSHTHTHTNKPLQVAAAVKSTTARGTPHPPAPTNPSSDLVQLSALVRIVAVMAVEQDMEQQEHQAQLREVYAKQDVEPLPSDMVQGIVDVLYDKYDDGLGGGRVDRGRCCVMSMMTGGVDTHG